MRSRYVLHYIVLPLILVFSDLFIGFVGHYSGTVGITHILSYSNFMQYISMESTKTELLCVFVVALIIVGLVELIVQEDKKWTRGKRK